LKLNNALIGFHQSPSLINYIKNKHSEVDKPICHYNEHIDYLKNLQQSELGIIDFWKETLHRLDLRDFQLKELESCIEVGFSFENTLWFPTNNQLKEKYKLSFTGTVCSDNYDCYSSVLDEYASNGTKFVIGDEVYISKGR